MTTWILVADESRARVFAAQQANGELSELRSFTHPAGRAHGRDITTERPPSTFESVGSARHAIEPHTDRETVEAGRFAQQLVSFLESGRLAHEFQRLVLVAAPRFLGVLRAELSGSLRNLVVLDLAKEVTHEDADAIRERVAEVL